MLCGYTSTLIINNFTRAHEGLYTCNASQPNSNSSSDSVYVLIEIIPPAGEEIAISCYYICIAYKYFLLALSDRKSQGKNALRMQLIYNGFKF